MRKPKLNIESIRPGVEVFGGMMAASFVGQKISEANIQVLQNTPWLTGALITGAGIFLTATQRNKMLKNIGLGMAGAGINSVYLNIAAGGTGATAALPRVSRGVRGPSNIFPGERMDTHRIAATPGAAGVTLQ